MPPIDAEQHLKFLLSCIKHASAGKVNFDAVAQELGIVSKAAAAKRYERLLKAHDINPANIPKGGADSSPAKGGRATTKRKRVAAANVAPPLKDEDDESEEQPMIAKKEKKAAAAVKKGGKKGENDKLGDGGGVGLYEIPEYPRHLLAGGSQKEGDVVGEEEEEDDEVVFLGESIQPGRRSQSSTARAGQMKVEGGDVGSTTSGGHGNNGWNYANTGFHFEQRNSIPPVMGRSEGVVMPTIMIRERSEGSSQMGYYHGAQVAHAQEQSQLGYGGEGSTAAAAAVSGDVNLQQIYRQQFGDQSYEH